MYFFQETGDKVKDHGHVVYIAGPDPSLSNNISIFPNLEDNQVKFMSSLALIDVRVDTIITFH